jgi:two-component system response regulator PilR (NtrC family)
MIEKTINAKILIIDDEELFREDLAVLLKDEGFECLTASDGEKGINLAQNFAPDIILCDISMPGKTGIDILDELKCYCPDAGIIIITAFGSLETSIAAFRKGASDYILKPLVFEDVLQKIRKFLKYQEMIQEVAYLRRTLSIHGSPSNIIGNSDVIKEIKELIHKVAPTNSTVLIKGESGTGKEVIANAIHEASKRNKNRFVAVNCAAIQGALLESELYGHRKGSFTGAIKDKEGLFEVANRATLFLDEIAEMPLDQQAKLLRAIEEKVIQPVGETKPISIDVRIITSTNRDLIDLVKMGKFRKDLYYRLRVVEISAPPLRNRKNDIPLLIEHFIKMLNQQLKKHYLGVDREAMKILLAYSWPGNVRELLNTLERSMIVGSGEYVCLGDLPSDIAGSFQVPRISSNLRVTLKTFEREHIRQILKETRGNREETARQLGINVATLYRKLSDLDLG